MQNVRHFLERGDSVDDMTPDEAAGYFVGLWENPEIGMGRLTPDGRMTAANESLSAALNRSWPEMRDFCITDLMDLGREGAEGRALTENIKLAKAGYSSGFGMSVTLRRKQNGPVSGRLRMIRLGPDGRASKGGEITGFLLTFIPMRTTVLPTASDNKGIPLAYRLTQMVLKHGPGLAMITGWLVAIAAMAMQMVGK